MPQPLAKSFDSKMRRNRVEMILFTTISSPRRSQAGSPALTIHAFSAMEMNRDMYQPLGS
jgi:hypothetical protein